MNDPDITLPSDVRPFVRERYGRLAADFQPESAASCCGPQDQVSQLYELPDVANLPPDVTGLSLGCGDPISLASLQPGQTVLDLGSGGGIDCFLAARRVGAGGRVIGVDMTPEMVEKARQNQVRLGAENVEFRLGEIEHLPVADSSVDVIISNCVINLSPDKPQVFREAFRVLKPGGRIAVSDIVTNGPLPQVIQENLSAWAGCISGALDADEYLSALQAAGFVDVELSPAHQNVESLISAPQTPNPEEDDRKENTRLILRDDIGSVSIELDPGNLDLESLQDSVFSAKITAWKPSS